ncbi:hypothetical protein SISSUDRAFT_1065747 [Sistotremastrum suecicum HHB10207 ss-3]|uniref:Uncharacterized protein n=1 Tax=Sistotremastrum suecicum HHB10207 ss-3 TaxID=1314776 RepID=A0A165Z4N5_9AGAM|nr:hypothetical protein SISSUDRAFT_1065747 [Sistotremastrum suecicum HHB10207 ss-3]
MSPIPRGHLSSSNIPPSSWNKAKTPQLNKKRSVTSFLFGSRGKKDKEMRAESIACASDASLAGLSRSINYAPSRDDTPPFAPPTIPNARRTPLNRVWEGAPDASNASPKEQDALTTSVSRSDSEPLRRVPVPDLLDPSTTPKLSSTPKLSITTATLSSRPLSEAPTHPYSIAPLRRQSSSIELTGASTAPVTADRPSPPSPIRKASVEVPRKRESCASNARRASTATDRMSLRQAFHEHNVPPCPPAPPPNVPLPAPPTSPNASFMEAFTPEGSPRSIGVTSTPPPRPRGTSIISQHSSPRPNSQHATIASSPRNSTRHPSVVTFADTNTPSLHSPLIPSPMSSPRLSFSSKRASKDTGSPRSDKSDRKSSKRASANEPPETLSNAELYEALRTQRSRFDALASHLLQVTARLEAERASYERRVEALEMEAKAKAQETAGLKWIVTNWNETHRDSLASGKGSMSPGAHLRRVSSMPHITITSPVMKATPSTTTTPSASQEGLGIHMPALEPSSSTESVDTTGSPLANIDAQLSPAAVIIDSPGKTVSSFNTPLILDELANIGAALGIEFSP